MSNSRAPTPAAPSNDVTVMVFKDNHAARSFQVPLEWITRFGFGVGILAAAALLSTFFALKYYRIAGKADLSHVISLEQQVGDLKSANRALESKAATTTVNSLPAPAAIPTATTTAAATTSPLPIPTVTVTVTPTATAAAPTTASAPVAASSPMGTVALFSALPRKSQDLSAQAAKLPITVSPAKTSWSSSGRTFKVDFNIQYTGTDRGSQQGRIIVLARGAASLLAYPEGALARAGAESLIDPQQGEYFSVSRFRETRAEFTEVKGGAKGIKDVEILIFGSEGNLISYQKLAASAAPAAPKAAPAPKPTAPASTPPAAPAAGGGTATSNELIEPGVDQ